MVGARGLGGVVQLTTIVAIAASSGRPIRSPPGAQSSGPVGAEKLTGDLIPVTDDTPPGYRPDIDGIGRIPFRCTAFYVGKGIAVTAGHCFLPDGSPWDTQPVVGEDCRASKLVPRIEWGYREQTSPYQTSKCAAVILREYSGAHDYAIFSLEPPVDKIVAVHPSYAKTPSLQTQLTIFGHPYAAPLRWSQFCDLLSEDVGPWHGRPPEAYGWQSANRFAYTCSTDGGSSGSPVFDATATPPAVIGVHNGGEDSTDGHGNKVAYNYATSLSDPVIATCLAKLSEDPTASCASVVEAPTPSGAAASPPPNAAAQPSAPASHPQ